MTDAKHTTEHQTLDHYREQATGEPPAHLDALILAAARNAVKRKRNTKNILMKQKKKKKVKNKNR